MKILLKMCIRDSPSIVAPTKSFTSFRDFPNGLMTISCCPISSSTIRPKFFSPTLTIMRYCSSLDSLGRFNSVSYTHLDVYKRQSACPPQSSWINWKPICGFTSKSSVPLKGGILKTVNRVGFGMDRVNSS